MGRGGRALTISLKGHSPQGLVTVTPSFQSLSQVRGQALSSGILIQCQETCPPVGMCSLRRSSLSLRFQRKCQVRGLLSVLGEGSAWGAVPQTALCVPNTSHQCPCLSSAPGLPTGPRSWSSSTWRLGQGMGRLCGTLSPSEMEATPDPGSSSPIMHGKCPCSSGHHGLAGEMSSGDYR